MGTQMQYPPAHIVILGKGPRLPISRPTSRILLSLTIRREPLQPADGAVERLEDERDSESWGRNQDQVCEAWTWAPIQAPGRRDATVQRTYVLGIRT